MKKYKLIECYINSLLLLAFVVWFFLTDNQGYFSERLIVLALGSPILLLYQFFTILIQHAKVWFKNSIRIFLQYFIYTIIVIILFFPLSFLTRSLYFGIIPLLFLFYTGLCFFEYYQLKNTTTYKIENKVRMLKRMDLLVQLIVIVYSIFTFFVGREKEPSYDLVFNNDFFLSTNIICARISFLQLISIIIHHTTKCFQNTPRKQYQYISYVVAILWVCLAFLSILKEIKFFVELFYPLSLMVIFYFCLCLYEYKQLRKLK